MRLYDYKRNDRDFSFYGYISLTQVVIICDTPPQMQFFIEITMLQTSIVGWLHVLPLINSTKFLKKTGETTRTYIICCNIYSETKSYEGKRLNVIFY